MNTRYILFKLLLLSTEIIIAIYIHDQFIRPFFGDYLAVILVYCGLKIFNQNIFKTALISLLIAYFIEILQYFKIIEITELINNKALAVVIGNSFSCLDILAYTLGFGFILIMENFEILRILWKLQFESTKKR